MSYIDQSLGQNERVLARAYMAWIYRVSAWLALIAGVALAGGLLVFLDRHTMALLAAGVSAALGIAAFIVILIPVWTTEIAVTNQRLIVKRGLFTHSSEELQLRSIEEVDWEQGLFDRLFGFGRLVICGTGEEEMRLPAISDALTFRKAVQQAISDAQPGQRSV